MAGFIGMNLNPNQTTNPWGTSFQGANMAAGGNYYLNPNPQILGAQAPTPNPWADVKVVDKTSSTGGGGGEIYCSYSYCFQS